MNFSEIFLSVVLLLIMARLLGEVFRRFKQPALGGELLAGIILGPALLGVVLVTDELEILSMVSIFFVMLFVGLEMDVREIKKAGKSPFVISIISLIIPFLIGFFISDYFGLEFTSSLFIGLLLSVTSVPVSAIILVELGIIKTKIGTTIISSAVVDDIISIILLAIILQIHFAGELEFNSVELTSSVFGIIGFLIGVTVLGIIIYKTNIRFPTIFQNIFARAKTREAVFGILIILAISMSVIAENVGLHFIIGTFFAGLIFSKKILGNKESDKAYGIVSGISFGFFAPLFFAIIGLKFSADIDQFIPLLAALIIFGIFGKTIGGYIGSKICKFSNKESLAIASLLNGRGTVGLAISAMAFSVGIIDVSIFSVCIMICFITTIITPIMSKPFLNKINFD